MTHWLFVLKCSNLFSWSFMSLKALASKCHSLKLNWSVSVEWPSRSNMILFTNFQLWTSTPRMISFLCIIISVFALFLMLIVRLEFVTLYTPSCTCGSGDSPPVRIICPSTCAREVISLDVVGFNLTHTDDSVYGEIDTFDTAYICKELLLNSFKRSFLVSSFS